MRLSRNGGLLCVLVYLAHPCAMPWGGSKGRGFLCAMPRAFDRQGDYAGGLLNSIAVRLMIEPSAAALACNLISGEVLRTLREMLEKIEADPDPVPAFVWAFDDALHNGIAEASGKPFPRRHHRSVRRYTNNF